MIFSTLTRSESGHSYSELGDLYLALKICFPSAWEGGGIFNALGVHFRAVLIFLCIMRIV